MAEHVLGVDGGGTQTRAVLADMNGRVLGRGSAGSSNLHAVGEEAALEALRTAIAEAWRAAQLPAGLPHAACLGLAGAARPADRERLRLWAARALPGVALEVVTDAELVLAAGTPAGWGVGVVCGTGSIAFGRGPDGRMARAGGWGWAMGDEGSGYAMGLATLRAVARAADGRGPRTALSDTVRAHWSLASAEDLIQRVYRAPYPRADIAALAGLVEAAALAGDQTAGAIVRESAGELALAVMTVVRTLGLVGTIPAALAGGVFVNGKAVREAFAAAIEAAGVRLEPLRTVEEPAMGAVALARRIGK
jgi:N-acetylglucosamine kinase-like BadF-type ATPase